MTYHYRALSNDELNQHVADIQAQGFCLLEDAIPAALLADLTAELNHLEQLRPGGDVPPRPFSGQVTRRWFDVLNDGDVWIDTATHPQVLQIMQAVLGEGFLLSTVGASFIGPGEAAQPLHHDDQIYGFPRGHQHIVCNSMWALTDFTDANGATRIVPGSHLWPDSPDPDVSYETIPIEMPQGTIAIFLGSAFHGGGNNRTADEVREGVTVNYCSGAIRQQENFMLAIHPERMLSFPEALQDILGFKLYNSAGHVFASEPRVELERRFRSNPEAGRGDRSQRNGVYAEYLAGLKATADDS